jgi:hypothetical protein
MKRAILIVAVSLFSVVSISAGEIPFTLEKGFIVVRGKAKKDQPVQAIIFTGSTFSFFDRDLLKRLKVDLITTNDLSVGVGKEEAISFANIPDLTFADERPVEVKMRQRSFDTIEKNLGHNIDMILGVDYLNGRILQIDFQKRVIRFLDKAPFDYESAKANNSSGGVHVAMRMDEHLRTIFGDAVSLPVTESVTLNGDRIRTLFDTGSVYPVTIGPYASKKFSSGDLPAKGAVAKTQLRSIDIAGYEMSDVPALLSSSWEDTETRYAAVIGVGVMQNFTVTFDWKNKWIALER